jgi:riboflavin synthase
MFTGLIQETGRVLAPPPRLHIRCRLAGALKRGDSVAVDGVCLTVTDLAAGTFRADVMPETLRRSTLGRLRTGSEANLERAIAAGDALDGHLVTGHVDGTGLIRSVAAEGNALVYTISCAGKITALLAEKGSVAVDGISLTVVSVSTGLFSVSVIPHTRMATTLKNKQSGDPVNIECDPVARYVHRNTTAPPETIKRTSTFLRTLQENGFTGDSQ